MKWKFYIIFMTAIITFLITSSSLLAPVIATNPLYNWDVDQITTDNEPKFFMNVVSKNTGAVLSYLTNSTFLNLTAINLKENNPAGVVTIEKYTTQTSAHPSIRFDYKLAILNQNNQLLGQPITLAHNVLGYKYPLIIDSQNRVHTLYITSQLNVTHPYNSAKTYNATFLYYVRFDHLFDPTPNLTPDVTRLLNNPKIDIVADPDMVLDPNEQILYVTWSSRLNVRPYLSGTSLFDYAFTITYTRFDMSANSTTTWRVANSYPNFSPPSNINYRRPGLFLSGDTMFLVYNEFPQKAVETFLRIISFPKNPASMNWTNGDSTHAVGFTKGVYITRLTGGYYTRTPEIFIFGKYLWVGWVVELGSKDVPSVAYTENTNIITNKTSWLSVRFNQYSRDMLSISFTRSPNGERAHLIWSLYYKPDNPNLPWTYDSYLATIHHDFTDPQSAWSINRISLVPNIAHTYPVVTYIGGNLETFWIQIKSNKYDVYVAHEPYIPSFNNKPAQAFLLTLIIETTLTIILSVYIIKYVKSEVHTNNVGRIDTS